MATINAIYENGVFKPINPVVLPEGTPVCVDTLTAPKTTALDEAMQKLLHRTPEQITADRERLMALSPAPHPLPEGKTLADVIVGKWPGNETDAQISEALERLS